MAAEESLKDKLVKDFLAYEKSLNGKSQSTFHATRKKALETFEKLGFPSIKNEEWKYTSVAEILKHSYEVSPGISKLTKSDIEKYFIKELDANHLVFINGAFRHDLSVISTPENELSLKNLSDIIYTELFASIKPLFGKYIRYNTDGFIALNNSFSENGIFIDIPANKIVAKPIIIYFISDTSTGNILSLPQVLIRANENCQVEIIENFISIGENSSCTNIISEFVIEEDAHVTYYKIENEGKNTNHIGTTQVNQIGKSVFNAVTVSLSGDMVRNNFNVSIEKPFCETHLFGLALFNGTNHVDNHTVVDHMAPHCESNELYKTILDEHASGVFNGKIFVRQDAQKTNAYQSSKNILLSKEAVANSKPQLEIWADDVKCSHGSTTGQLDKDALFYLKARGIGDQKAMAMLTQAFAQDILNAIKIEPLKLYLEKLIEERFNQVEF